MERRAPGVNFGYYTVERFSRHPSGDVASGLFDSHTWS